MGEGGGEEKGNDRMKNRKTADQWAKNRMERRQRQARTAGGLYPADCIYCLFTVIPFARPYILKGKRVPEKLHDFWNAWIWTADGLRNIL